MARIEEGDHGDEIRFTLMHWGNRDLIQVNYRGRMENGVLRLKMQYKQREPVDVTATRL
jgi:hypothetical protein